MCLFLLRESEAWDLDMFSENRKFSKHHDPSIQNELTLGQTASRGAETKDAERHLISSRAGC